MKAGDRFPCIIDSETVVMARRLRNEAVGERRWIAIAVLEGLNAAKVAGLQIPEDGNVQS